ncbi:hypothetical protein DPEC_G00281280 [Dallia pectoralis]|uniref:Uncharacterized protein n=1 Tax=Dallia pectoralis TaxID=75939 RepID=A0ACC2FN00_DALPE|nr:hypothetical protein DPEC_G00281280 [Dallia pectoralis]
MQLATHLGLKLLSATHFSRLRKRRVPPGGNSWKLQPPVLRQITEQSSRPPCDTQMWGYLNLLISYCHVMFFSGIYPQVPLWCLVTVGTNCHTDLWRLCSGVRRPFPQTSHRDDVLWQRVFRGAEALAVLFHSVLLWSSLNSGSLILTTGWELGFLLLILLLFSQRGAVSSLVRADGRPAEPPGTCHPRLQRHQRRQHQQQQC